MTRVEQSLLVTVDCVESFRRKLACLTAPHPIRIDIRILHFSEKLVVPKAFTLARGRPWMPDLLSVSPALRYLYLMLTAFSAQCHTPPL
jgi:hypothetical protein